MKAPTAIALGLGAGVLALGGAALAMLRGKMKASQPLGATQTERQTTAANPSQFAPEQGVTQRPGMASTSQWGGQGATAGFGTQLQQTAGNVVNQVVNQGLSQLTAVATNGLNNALSGVLSGLHF
jgi:hypothetical protein